jgi:ATP-dependent RNA helicase DeaD
LFQKVDAAKREMQAIVLAPTHELAMQIFRQAELLAQNSGEAVTATVIIGEVNITRQIDKLKEKPHIIIGSAGRILELIQKRKINAQTIKTIVVDEADRLLDDSNRAAVASVIRATQKDRQLMLFSATITPAAIGTAGEWMQDPVFSTVQAEAHVPTGIDHVFITTEAREKVDTLRKLLASLQPGRALVFVNTANSIAEVVAKLCHHGVAAVGIHGSSIKGERQSAMEDFRAGRARVLVASDLAARGLDIPGVETVINLDLPEEPQSYLHRAGRTGRAGELGSVISVVDRSEARHINFLQKSLQICMPEKMLSYGKIVDVSKPVQREHRQKTK